MSPVLVRLCGVSFELCLTNCVQQVVYLPERWLINQSINLRGHVFRKVSMTNNYA
jgi:hypothetical protein